MMFLHFSNLIFLIFQYLFFEKLRFIYLLIFNIILNYLFQIFCYF